MIDVGTDINRNLLFKDGDIVLVSDYANICQAIVNRLSTYLDTMDMFYYRYGSLLDDYMGDLSNSRVHEYIRIEVEDCLKRDERFKRVVCNVNRGKNGVDVHIKLLLFNDYETTINLVITEDNKIDIISNNLTDNQVEV